MRSQKSLFFLLMGLYFSQGLPSGILAHALPAVMREYGASLELIGLAKLLAIPWFLKFLWAPYIDQYWSRKYWILCFQSMVIMILLVLASVDPQSLFEHYLLPGLALLLLLNACSASQDVASDGLAVRHIQPRELGLANSIQVGAYKVGMMAGGTLLLVMLDKLGWQFSLQLFAATLVVALLPVFRLHHGENAPTGETARPGGHSGWKEVFTGFIHEPHLANWLLVVITYKMADGLSSSMIKPMLVDHGYSLADIGMMGAMASATGIAGAIAGGFLFLKMSLRTTLIGFGLLQASANGLLALVPSLLADHGLILAITLYEQFTDNLATVALFSAMMMHCRRGLEGTDYTLQNCFFLAGSGSAALASGFITKAIGYESLFIMASMVGILSCAFILRLQPVRASAA